MTERAPLSVGGLTPFTTIDFPGRLAAVVFCQGCPLRCGYCHNPHLIAPAAAHAGALAWPEVLAWLDTRIGLLDGVVFSGGEPLLQRGLGRALREVRDRGFAAGLHTSGVYPERFAAVLPALDWIGLDIKAPFGEYARVAGARAGDRVRRALSALLACGTPHEIRCTVDPAVLGVEEIECMARELAVLGVPRLVLQACRGPGRGAALPADIVAAARAFLPQVETRSD